MAFPALLCQISNLSKNNRLTNQNQNNLTIMLK